MPTVRCVLCPVDFSEQSRQALLWASAIANYRGATLTALSVVEPLLAQAADIRLGVDLAHAEAEPLREFVETTLPEDARRASYVRLEVAVGDAPAAILQCARALDAGLIVMGTHGRGGARKLLLGSTTEQVLRRTEWPVLAVPPGAVSAPTVEHPGVHVKRILVATDFRESATAAMEWASGLASDIGVPLVFAHVVEPVAASSEWQGFTADAEGDRIVSAQRRLARFAASLREAHTECVVSVGRPDDTIVSLAIEHEADLVVMGLANAEDSALHTPPGSIAYRVLRLAHVAVVVVPRHAMDAARDQPGACRLAIESRAEGGR